MRLPCSLPYLYTRYHSESHCLKNGLTYTLDADVTGADSTDVIGVGSLGLHSIFGLLGVTNETYVDCDAGHGIDTFTNASGFLTNNYGLPGVTNVDSVYKYIAQRAATFFQAVLTGKDNQLNTTLFTECVNLRVRSALASALDDSIGNCPNSNAACPKIARIIDDDPDE